MILLLVAMLCLPAAVVADKTVGDVYQAGDTAGWVLSQAEREIGSHWFRYEGPVDLAGQPAHHFTAATWLEAISNYLPGQYLEADLWVDDHGHPLRHVLDTRVGDVLTRIEAEFAGGKVSVQIEQGGPGGQLQEFDRELSAGGFLQTNNMIGYFELMFALELPGEAEELSYELFSFNTLASLHYRARRGHDPAPAEGEAKVATLKDTLGEVLHVSEDGRLLGLEVPAQQVVVRRRAGVRAEMLRAEAARAEQASASEDEQQAAPSMGMDAEEVVIRHGEVQLGGTVTRPLGATGRLPGVFFISGSGGQDRNGFSSGMDVGTHEILDHLTRAGFMVLRVDDRGLGASVGPTANLSFDDLVADARACVDYLLQREDVDPARVVLIGHSEGGITAPILATERPQIAAIVLMAATGRSLVDVMLDQNKQALLDAGVTGATLEQQMVEIRSVLERVSGEGPLAAVELPEQMRHVMPMRAWLQSHARQDPVANIARVLCPVLLVQGVEDVQVSPELDAKPLNEALDRAGHTQHRLVLLPGLDHLFKPITGATSTFEDYFKDRRVDAALLELLTTWIQENT